MTKHPRYETREAKDGSFYFVLLGANGEVVETSETYPTKQHAERGIQDAQDASATAAEVEADAEG